MSGTLFGERIVMWWDVVGRSHEEVVEARQHREPASDRLGVPTAVQAAVSPALPEATIAPRGNPHTSERRHTMTRAAVPTVRNVDARHRYETLFDGAGAGFTAYRDHDGQRVFFHTGNDGAHAGRGPACVLVQEVWGHVRASGRRVVPACPYVAKFLRKHEEFAGLTDPVVPGTIRQWLEAARAPGPPERRPGHGAGAVRPAAARTSRRPVRPGSRTCR